MQAKLKPVALTFYQLQMSMSSVHQWNKADIDDLHDVWLKGAPTPDSRLQDYKNYDPRLWQTGNVEKRLVLPTVFAQWFDTICKRKGWDVPAATAYQALYRVDRILNRSNYDKSLFMKGNG